MHNAPIPAAASNGGCHDVNKPPAIFRELSAATDPRRAIVRLIAIAKDNCFALNHFPKMVVAATINGSEPTPKTNLPSIIPWWDGNNAMQRPPIAAMVENNTIERFV